MAYWVKHVVSVGIQVCLMILRHRVQEFTYRTRRCILRMQGLAWNERHRDDAWETESGKGGRSKDDFMRCYYMKSRDSPTLSISYLRGCSTEVCGHGYAFEAGPIQPPPGHGTSHHTLYLPPLHMQSDPLSPTSPPPLSAGLAKPLCEHVGM